MYRYMAVFRNFLMQNQKILSDNINNIEKTQIRC